MPPPVRLLLAALVLAALAASAGPAHAQRPCQGGFALDPADGVTRYPCSNAALLSRLPLLDMGVPLNGPLPYRGNDVWGWTDPQTGRDYALVGNQSGTYFVDVTNPRNPRPLGAVATQTVASTWRDVKVYGHHAYVVADGAGAHGMQVFDLRRLRGLSPDPARRFTPDHVYTGGAGHTLNSAHNVAVNEDTGYAYVVGASDCAGGLHMVDVRDPAAPAFAGCFSQDGYTHDVHCVVYHGPDADYAGREICVAANENDFVVVDVTDKASPALVSRALYPNPAYTHQGWLSEDHRYFVGNDENDEIQGFVPRTRTLLFDFADLDAPELVTEYLHPTQATDHNLYVRADVVYEANDKAGLRYLRLGTLPGEPPLRTVGFLDTHPESDASGFEGAWSVYPFFGPSGVPPVKSVVSDRTRGLFVVAGPYEVEDLAFRSAPAGDEVAVEGDAAESFALEAAPNPFADRTMLTLAVGTPQRVRVALYDALGRRVATPFEGTLAAGAPHAVEVDGRGLPPGTYFVRVEGEHFTATRPLVRAR